MWMLVNYLVWIGLFLQVHTDHPSCFLKGQHADCHSKGHYWVPVLPPIITHLYLEMNYISEINSTSLRAYVELQHLDLGHQNVVLVIRNGAFLSQTKLTHLVLGFNVGLKLEPRAFVGLFNLQNLFLDYCGLSDSILTESYLEPLLRLEMLNLFGNHIVILRPGLFFSNLTKFTYLNLKLNKIEKICEDDLIGFWGKRFTLLLQSNRFYNSDSPWGSCGNPFKGLAFNVLDISGNGLSMRTREFFKAIEGTPISHLIYSDSLGKDFSHNNLPDPDNCTFQGLKNSSIVILEIPRNRIFSLKSGVFSPLKDALIIDISQNKINQIERDAFSGLQERLQMLNLSYNLLGEIFSHTFTSLTELRLLDLSYNHIGAFGYRAFSGLPNLETLDLTGNSLRNMGFPESLPQLKVLSLGDNKLDTLSQIIDFGMNTVYIDISDNRLTNMEDVYVILAHLKHLRYLLYGGNFIKWCTLNQGIAIPHNNSLQLLDLHGSSMHILWSQGQCLNLFDNLQNLIRLNMSFNSLTTLPQGIFKGLSSIEGIDLSSNALTYLHAGVFPVSLKTLILSNNFLASPDPMTFQSLSFVSLSENRFHCDCTLEIFLKWLNMTNVTFLSPVQDYRCEFPAAVHGLPLLEYSMIIEPCEEDDEKTVHALKGILFALSATLIMSVTFCGIIYAHLRGQIFIIYKKIAGRVLEGSKRTPPENDLKFDAFVCFSNNNYRWVEAALLKQLDNQFSEENLLRCCFEARDFLPGEDHLSNIRDAIWGSRKTLCIVSKSFLKDGWCLEAFTLAQSRMLEELTNILIMVVVGKVAHYQLMKCNAVRAFVQRREYLTWPDDPQDLEWFYDQLITQILKDTKLKNFKVDKLEPAEPEHQPGAVEEILLENVRAIAK